MNIIELWSLENLYGIIVLAKTGVWYSNQVGGTCCCHPKAEGYYVPLPIFWHPEHDVLIDRAEPYNRDLVEKFLTSSQDLPMYFEPLDNDYLATLDLLEDHNTDLYEAWVPVKIIHSYNNLLPKGKIGILTYVNSD
jgi:hypothetical protein